MSKELIENLLIEFDEMGFEPTTLCDTEREVDSFRNRLKQVLDYLKAIDNAKPSEALESLEELKGIEISAMPFKDDCGIQEVDLNDIRKVGSQLNTDFREYTDTIKQALLKAQEQEKVLKFIFKKQVDINEIKILLSNLKHCDDVERCKRYNASRKVGYKLKQEEFDLLKRYCDEQTRK